MSRLFSSVISAAVLATAGCAAMQSQKTPDFYPNATLQREGPQQARAAAQYCMAMADEYVQKPDRFKDAAKTGLGGAVIGAGTGAVGGAIFSKAGRGTGAGAAIGGILGVLQSLNETGENSPSYERFVERCLQQKGYEVIGWSSK